MPLSSAPGAGVASLFPLQKSHLSDRELVSCLHSWRKNSKIVRRDFRPLRSSVSGESRSSVEVDVPFPRDYDELLEQAKRATELAVSDNRQLMEIEFPTSGLDSVPGDGEGGIEMTGSMQLIREFCDQLVDSEKVTRTRIFFPEANEVKFARKSAFEGASFKLDYLTKPSFFEDFGFTEKVKMTDRVRPEDELFLVAYPYFNVNEMLVVEELYKEAVGNTARNLIIFNGELDRIRYFNVSQADAGALDLVYMFMLKMSIAQESCRFNGQVVEPHPHHKHYWRLMCLSGLLWTFLRKLAALIKTLFPKMETVYYIHNFKGMKGGTLFRCYPGPWKVLRRVGNQYVTLHQQEAMPSLKEVALNILPSS